jgi:hypothetical protein
MYLRYKTKYEEAAEYIKILESKNLNKDFTSKEY